MAEATPLPKELTADQVTCLIRLLDFYLDIHGVNDQIKSDQDQLQAIREYLKS